MELEQRARFFLEKLWDKIKYGDVQHQLWLQEELNEWIPELTNQFEIVEQETQETCDTEL